MSLFIIGYLVVVIVLPVALSVVIGWRTLPRGRTCPLCRAETVSIRARWLRRLSRMGGATVVQRRWCMECGWQGLSRCDGPEPTEPGAAGPGGGAASAEGRPDAPAASGEAVDLRRLDVNGEDWRVLVQCWCEGDRWYGRLLFHGPSGRVWVDPSQSFSGRAPEEVLAQALALPDRALAYRLREVVSD